MKHFKIVFAFAFLLSIVFIACKKESGTSTLHVKLTDAPANWDEVNIDLKEVKVNFNDDTAGWVSLETRDTIYNLLGLQNGLDTLIAQATVPAKTVNEIRLVLGNNNTIKANGQIYPLTIPSGSTSGLKVKLHKKLSATIETVVLDFDAGASVTQDAEGYKLRPVITVK